MIAVESFEETMRLVALVEAIRPYSRPADSYAPGRDNWPEAKRFQLQFHRSKHIIRAMFPGNGAGKTTVAGVEADYWLQHRHPYQATPTWPVQVIWVCLKFQQMDLLRQQLEQTCLTPGWSWNDQKHRYTWPNHSTLTVVSNDGDWGSIQGIPADLVIIDEECDERLWRELSMRRRGRKKTRYVISATATKGKRWMWRLIYDPWVKYHDALGMNADQAMVAQKHPTRWVWPKGGLADNPAHSEDDVAWYEAELAYASPAEREVRLHGGFVDLNASPVFDQVNLKKMADRCKAMGLIGQDGIFVPAVKRAKPQAMAEFDFVPGQPYEGGRITIYDYPDPEDYYAIGADFGAGLQNRDWDAAVVIGQKSKRVMATARGRWGDVHFAWVLWAMGWYYNEALLVGERQFGLPTLRRLYDEWGYCYQYCDVEDEAAKGQRKSDLLGHHRYHGDLVIPRLCWAIAPQERDAKGRLTGKVFDPIFEVPDDQLLEELRRYEWRPKSDALEMSDATSKDLTCGAPRGYFDDLVMAMAYAVMGWIELPRFQAHRPVFKPGSMGERLGHSKVLQMAGSKPESGPFKFAHPR